jgi:hypothetical protein
MKIIECSISENQRIYCPCTDETLERGKACGPTLHTAWLVVPADTIIEEVAGTETEKAD